IQRRASSGLGGTCQHRQHHDLCARYKFEAESDGKSPRGLEVTARAFEHELRQKRGYFLPKVVLSVISLAPGTSIPASIAALIATLSTVTDKSLVVVASTASRNAGSRALRMSSHIAAPMWTMARL